jgi:hypothetical protein
LQALLIVYPAPVLAVIGQDVLVPAGEEVKSAGNDVLPENTSIIGKGKQTSALRKQKGDMLAFEFCEVYFLQGIELSFLKKIRCCRSK